MILFSADESADEFEPPKSYASHNRHFHVISKDMSSAAFVSRLGEKLTLQVRRWLPVPEATNPRIQVRLDPYLRDTHSRAFHTTSETGGIVTVSIQWDETTSLDIVERALAHALLTRIAIWNYGVVDGTRIPLWLELAVQQELRSSGEPAFVDSMAEKVRELGHLSVDEIVRRDRNQPVDEAFSVSAYWFLRHLQEQGGHSGVLNHFIARLLSGEDPLNSLTATFGERFRRQEDVSLWWAVGLYDNLLGRMRMQERFIDSGRRISEFSRFTYLKEGKLVRLNIKELLEYREEPLVARDVEQRLERLHFEVHRIHPFHHNSLLSLMHTLHAFSEGDDDEFEEAYARFQDDMRDGEELHRETHDILDQAEAELRRR
ncbi:MAG: hypothetical protein WD490_01740 [Opitutales bacterium]